MQGRSGWGVFIKKLIKDDAGQISFEMFVVLLGLLIVAIFIFTSLGSTAKDTSKSVDDAVGKFSKKLQGALGE